MNDLIDDNYINKMIFLLFLILLFIYIIVIIRKFN